MYWRARALAAALREGLGAPRRLVTGSWRGLTEVMDFGRAVLREGGIVISVTALIAGSVEAVQAIILRFVSDSPLLLAPGQPYTDLRTLLPTVAGIFLGLYFTALATVLQSRYERVPAPVASLLTRDRAGGLYVQVLSVAICLSITEMVLEGIGRTPTRLHLIVLASVAIFALVGFANLGRRAFSFLDPTHLMETVAMDTMSAVRSVMVGGRVWESPQGQARARSHADQSLDVAQMIVELSREAPNSNARDSARRLHQQLAWMTGVYLVGKTQIPSGSQWFGQVARHRDWYRAGMSELDLALGTQTALQPTPEPDDEWFERRVLTLLADTVEHHAKTGSRAELAASLALLGECFFAMGRGWEIASGLRYVARVEAGVASTAMPDAADNQVGQERSQCVDLACLTRIQLVIGFGASVRNLDAARLQRVVANANWRKRTTPLRLGLTGLTRKLAEALQDQVTFESGVEGTPVTPAWFLSEQIARDLATEVKGSFTALITSAAAPLPTPSSDAWSVVAAALTVSRRLEECAKLEALLPIVNKIQLDLAALNKSRDYIWPAWTLAEVQTPLYAAARAARRAFAQLILPLTKLPANSDIPDLLGEAVSKSGEAALRADTAEFVQLFPHYFFGCLAVTAEMAKRPPSADPTADAVINTEAMIDLVAVSGYALLYSEVTGSKEAWAAVEGLWRSWIASQPQRLELIAAAIGMRWGLYGFTPRSIRRTSWDQMVAADLTERATSGNDLRHSTSPLVRVVARSPYGSLADGARIFTSQFLRTLPGAEAVDFGQDHLGDSIARETRRAAERQATGSAKPAATASTEVGADRDTELGDWEDDE